MQAHWQNVMKKGLWKLDTVPLISHMHAYIVAVTSNVIKAQAKTTHLHPVVWPEVVHTHYCILCGRIKNINNIVRICHKYQLCYIRRKYSTGVDKYSTAVLISLEYTNVLLFYPMQVYMDYIISYMALQSFLLC